MLFNGLFWIVKEKLYEKNENNILQLKIQNETIERLSRLCRMIYFIVLKKRFLIAFNLMLNLINSMIGINDTYSLTLIVPYYLF